MPHQTPWHSHYDAIERSAVSFLEPLRPKVTKRGDVTPPESGLLALESNGIVVSALKEAEDGNGIVLRTYNATPESVSGRIVFGIAPRSVQRVRIDERPTGEAADPVENVLADNWRAYEIKTYRLEY
jgi:alpha-mannosidase